MGSSFTAIDQSETEIRVVKSVKRKPDVGTENGQASAGVER